MGTDALSAIATETDDPTATQYLVTTDNNRSTAVFNGVFQGIYNRSRYLLNRLAELIGLPIAISGVNASTDVITTVGAHGLVANDPVRFKALGAGALPGGLSSSSVYYWLADTGTTGKVSLTAGGSAVNLTSTGTGPIYVVKVSDPLVQIFVPAAASAPAGTLRSLITTIFDGLNGRPFIGQGHTLTADAAKWSLIQSGTAPKWQNVDKTGAPFLWFRVSLPHGLTLDYVRVLYKGAGGHAALPATMPRIELAYIFNDTPDAVNYVGTANDPSASVAAFQDWHEIKINGGGHVVDVAEAVQYYLRVIPEGGANALDDAEVTLPQAVML